MFETRCQFVPTREITVPYGTGIAISISLFLQQLCVGYHFHILDYVCHFLIND